MNNTQHANNGSEVPGLTLNLPFYLGVRLNFSKTRTIKAALEIHSAAGALQSDSNFKCGCLCRIITLALTYGRACEICEGSSSQPSTSSVSCIDSHQSASDTNNFLFINWTAVDPESTVPPYELDSVFSVDLYWTEVRWRSQTVSEDLLNGYRRKWMKAGSHSLVSLFHLAESCPF